MSLSMVVHFSITGGAFELGVVRRLSLKAIYIRQTNEACQKSCGLYLINYREDDTVNDEGCAM